MSFEGGNTQKKGEIQVVKWEPKYANSPGLHAEGTIPFLQARALSTRKTSTESEKWRARSADVRSFLGISAAYQPWTGKPGVELRGLLRRERELDCIGIAYVQAMMTRDPREKEQDLLLKRATQSPDFCLS